MTAHSLRVLVVDDDRVARMSARRGLGGDVDVVEASSAEAALDALERERFDCVLLDHQLPGATGLELLPEVITHSVAVVMLTAGGDEQLAVEALKSGCQDYLSKRDLQGESLRRSVSRAVEQKQMQLEVRRTRAQLEMFARIAAHDLKAPSRQVRAFSQMALESLRAGDSDELEGQLEFIERSAHRMYELVTALHRHTRVGVEPLKLEALSLDSLVAALFDSIRSERPGVSLRKDELPEVVADRGSMMQVLQNVIENAVKYHGDAAVEVHVSAQTTDEAWSVSVTDAGPGIPAEGFELIFEPMRRLVSRGEVEGTGLGLATCRQIMTEHDGTIKVRSEVGRGSTFTIWWPRQRART